MTPTTNPVPGRTPDDHEAPVSAGASDFKGGRVKAKGKPCGCLPGERCHWCPRTAAPTASAPEVTHGERVPPMTCECRRSPHKPREQWTFTGRETHWGYTFLVWTRDDGKRWARVVL